jgi:hypothetical protein
MGSRRLNHPTSLVAKMADYAIGPRFARTRWAPIRPTRSSRTSSSVETRLPPEDRIKPEMRAAYLFLRHRCSQSSRRSSEIAEAIVTLPYHRERQYGILVAIGKRSRPDEKNTDRPDGRHRRRDRWFLRLRVLRATPRRQRGRGCVRADTCDGRQGKPRQGVIRPVESHRHGRRHRRRIGRAAVGECEDRELHGLGRQPAG